MNIGLIGSGGREHALCEKIHQSKLVKKIICFPGNAGTAKLALNVNVNILDFKKILKLIKIHRIDLVIVGPEEPLVKGIVDFLKKNKVNVFGPSKYAAKLEGSKAFMKMICAQNKIPTAKFKPLTPAAKSTSKVTRVSTTYKKTASKTAKATRRKRVLATTVTKARGTKISKRKTFKKKKPKKEKFDYSI